MHANGSARRSRAADSLEASGFHGRTCLPQSFLCIIMQKTRADVKVKKVVAEIADQFDMTRSSNISGQPPVGASSANAGSGFFPGLRHCFRQRDLNDWASYSAA